VPGVVSVVSCCMCCSYSLFFLFLMSLFVKKIDWRVKGCIFATEVTENTEVIHCCAMHYLDCMFKTNFQRTIKTGGDALVLFVRSRPVIFSVAVHYLGDHEGRPYV
jgi:hypothetical protein